MTRPGPCLLHAHHQRPARERAPRARPGDLAATPARRPMAATWSRNLTQSAPLTTKPDDGPAADGPPRL